MSLLIFYPMGHHRRQAKCRFQNMVKKKKKSNNQKMWFRMCSFLLKSDSSGRKTQKRVDIKTTQKLWHVFCVASKRRINLSQ